MMLDAEASTVSPSYNLTLVITTIAGLAIFAMLEIAGMMQTEGVFVYPLDDPYIHLSMAEQMVAGGYGVNAGEYASADSSLLFPVLLMPFSGTAFHAYLPLVYNAAGLLFSLVLLAKITFEAGLAARKRVLIPLLIAAPIALNFQGLALLGMEHMLHVATVLMALLGLMRWLKTDRINALLILAILLGPLLRYEGLGLSLVLSAAIFLSGRKTIGFALMLGAALPLLAFGLWLQSLGLSALPNSVLAKAPIVKSDASALWLILSSNFSTHGNPIFALFFIALSAVLSALAFWKWSDRPLRVIALVAAAMAFGHAIFGKFGWSDRYEIYALTFACLSLIVVLLRAIPRLRVLSVAFLGVMSGLLVYGSFLPLAAAYGPANIYAQQWQMAKYVQAWDAPVLANDIGLVSYNNPNKIVDLYGLASKEALEARRGQAPAGWPNRMAETENAGMALIYDGWLAQYLAPGWVPVAYLDRNLPVTVLPRRVTIYATSAEMVEPVIALMAGFSGSLPPYATLEITAMDDLQIEESRQND